MTVADSHSASRVDGVTTAGLVAKAGETPGVLAVLGARPAPPRLRATCEAAVQHVPCGLDGCGARAGQACDGETGVHVVRLGSAMKRRVITGAQLVEALQSALVFTGATVIRPDGAPVSAAAPAATAPDCRYLHSVQGPGCPWCAADPYPDAFGTCGCPCGCVNGADGRDNYCASCRAGRYGGAR